MQLPKTTVIWLICAIAACLPVLGGEPESIALVGATIIDVGDFGNSTEDLVDGVVLVDGGLITAVGPRSVVEIPKGVRVVDVAGHFLVPGLTDGFAAINNQAYADAHLECGVTSIIAVSGGRRGPLMTEVQRGPHIRRLKSVGDEGAMLEQHIEALEGLAEEGVEIALLMYALTPEQLQPLVHRAHELGLGTIGELGHTPYADGVAAGLDAVVHTTRYSLGLAPEAMAKAVADQPFSDDLESPKWSYYRWLSELSPSDPSIAAYAESLAGGRTALMPTFSLLHLDRPWAANPWKDPVARLLDASDIDAPAAAATGRHQYSAVRQVAYSAVARAQFLLEEAYFRAGARYLAGSATDVWGTMPGISLHAELDSLVRLGLTEGQALAAATSNFAAAFPNWGRRGEVKEGWSADLLVLSADPRVDIANLRAISMVVLGGEILERSAEVESGRDGD